MGVDHPEGGMQPGGSLGKREMVGSEKEDVMMAAGALVMQLEGREKRPAAQALEGKTSPRACRRAAPGHALALAR